MRLKLRRLGLHLLQLAFGQLHRQIFMERMRAADIFPSKAGEHLVELRFFFALDLRQGIEVFDLRKIIQVRRHLADEGQNCLVQQHRLFFPLTATIRQFVVANSRDEEHSSVPFEIRRKDMARHQCAGHPGVGLGKGFTVIVRDEVRFTELRRAGEYETVLRVVGTDSEGVDDVMRDVSKQGRGK